MFEYFYNESLRKLVLGVGNLFNNIYVGKYNNGTLKEKNRVPLTYSPKEKFIRRIQETSGLAPGLHYQKPTSLRKIQGTVGCVVSASQGCPIKA